MQSKARLEIEAKLLAPRENDLCAIARLERIGDYRLRPRDAVRLYSVYLDTLDFDLARHGVALRLRRHAGGWEMTAKWGGRVAGVVHERPELTVPLAAAPRFPFRPDRKLQPQLDRLIAGCALVPILVTHIYRRRIDVIAAGVEKAPVAELALDRVRLRPPQGRTPVVKYCEVEIERLRGPRRHVLLIAQLLRQHFSLQPSTESKFARGVTALYGADLSARLGHRVHRLGRGRA